jgi:molybdate transport system substrate-binding protein
VAARMTLTKAISIKLNIGLLLILSGLAVCSHGDTINIATASNFLTTAKQLKIAFEKSSAEKENPHRVNIISASTGQLSHQILNGAPYSVFLAANKQHPELLQAKLKLPSDNLFPYAQGSLVLVSHNPITQVPSLHTSLKDLLSKPSAANAANRAYTELETNIVRQVLTSANKVAMANGKLAPYGRASTEVLTSLNLLDSVKNKTVTGQNISQTHQFFVSGSVDAAFIASSQLTGLASKEKYKGIIPISKQLHKPIGQWGLMLNNSPASKAFTAFLSQPMAISIIKNNGYDILQQPAN